MRRPFVLGTERPAARNVILLCGGAGTGRHFALAETARIMAARGLLQSDRMAVMDLALYPDPGAEKLFLQDLYAALHAPGEIVVFEHYESCHPGFLRILSDLAVKGSAPLSSRYLVNKEGILVEAGTALAPGAVSRIDPCGKYLIFFSRKGREALADKFGAPFVAAVGDVCQTAPFTPEALAALAAQQLNALAQRVHSRLGLTLAAGAEVRDYVAAQCSKEKGAEGLADCCERIFRALSEYCLQTDAKLSGTVSLTAAPEGLQFALNGATPADLFSLLPAAYTGAVEQIRAELDALVGLAPVKEYVFGLADNLQVQQRRAAAGFKTASLSMHMIFTGNPGTGKTTIARLVAKYLKAIGKLKDLDESDEINACTVKIKCDVNGKDEDWLFLFKNETHNHPTEIEPFGGAATCIGGAIRDPLSGRSYVYQAMRVTGAGDPLKPVSETMPGKLPQRKLVTTAAAGYSSYGNQIGLATGQVDEIYHPGYVAKRMEIGAVVGATPASHVRRECPAPGDVIVLLGGRTGRDGVGGATGSSKAHKLDSLEHCGAEVQKGNAPIERKLQRLFRREDACRMIKRCNDFGAGGVSVAIGELADGLYIDLNKVTKKYEGLDGTELAISESQERMAVALAPEDVDKFIALANEENLEATPVAKVTAEPRLNMVWNGMSIVNISREFLNSNGAEKHQKVHVEKATVWQPQWEGLTFSQKMKNMVGDLNICSKKGLSERFDSTIGAATVLMPFGGAYQLTPQNAMVAKLPVDGETSTCSGMAWGYNPYLMSANQYVGARMAVIESVTKLVATGFRYEDAYLTFQEYFERLGNKPERWGKPLAALLGALDAQIGLGTVSYTHLTLPTIA